jgi:DNA-directed RNA polymerase subunit beta
LAAKNASKNQKNDRLAQRLSFAKVQEPIDIPDLLSLQTESFDWLVGAPAWRAIAGPTARTGLEEIFEEISPIEDAANSTQRECSTELTGLQCPGQIAVGTSE